MKKELLILFLAIMTGFAIGGGVWAQMDSAHGIFRGTIMGVDPAHKAFVVQNRDGQMIFRWTDETQVNEPREDKLGWDSEILKEGTKVAVTYRAGDPQGIADRIEVETGRTKARRGFSLPFECGINLC